MDSKEVFYIDSSFLMTLHRNYPQSSIPSLWDLIYQLFKDGKAISHRIVYDEIWHKQQDPDALAKWVQPLSYAFLPKTERQYKIMPSIILQHPKLIDPGAKKDQADPWLIAMILEKKDELLAVEHILVSQENDKSNKRLPAVESVGKVFYPLIFQ